MAELPIGGHGSTEKRVGWGLPGSSNRFHFFAEDGRSLCGKYGLYGGPIWDNGGDSECAACAKKRITRERRLAKAEGER
jgi:hypothetical protein